MNNIRYTWHKDSYYYNFSDIEKYLKDKIGIEKNLSYLMRVYLSKKNVSNKGHFNYCQSLSVTYFDEYYNWVVFGNVYGFLSEKQKKEVKNDGILEFIDVNTHNLAYDYYPQFKGLFKEVKLIEKAV